MMRVLLLALGACALAACGGRGPGEPRAVPLYTPSWAFEPWISKDISDGPDTYAFLAGFEERDIPVGVVVLDSPWETDYNTFVPNEARYPDFTGMVQDFRARGVRTVLWVTPMVNESSFDLEPGGDLYPGPAANYIEGQRENYFVNDGAVSFWWKGYGAAVDFFNPAAVEWWHAQQDALLDIGVAGWKLDFGEQYIEQQPIVTAAGDKTLQEYSEQYYRDFYEHGARTVGTKEFITMVRPYDESYGFAPRFYARPEHAPIAWVGDQLRDRRGLEDALDHVFRSAQAGYVVLGSDIGGYLDTSVGTDIPFELDTFRDWTAVSALMPFFQLHGRANLAPWTVPAEPALVEETVAQYRYWATLHHALVPYFFSASREAQLHGGPVLHVVGAGPAQWRNDWRFMAGPAFLVAPMIVAGNERDVVLPELEDGARWIDWWALGDEGLAGGTTIAFVADAQREMPLFVREGSIVPMVIDSDALTSGVNALGDPSFGAALTVLAFPPPLEAPAVSFVVHRDDDTTGKLTLSSTKVSSAALASTTLAIEGVPSRVIVRMRTSAEGGEHALVDGAEVIEAASLASLAEGPPAFFRDDDGRALWIAVEDGVASRVVLERTP